MTNQRPGQLNATVYVIDSRLQQILITLNQNAQNDTCWLNGKAFSQQGRGYGVRACGDLRRTA
ncbi:hypothetical protein HA48_15530 [Pantoea wallisii]|uniref:Uncharacterized protein n=1 Tax=Pantoea wallisii TaxID=1076551 RepID=A0A1X1D4A2_9GAMM|nr:hypothetical protein HA48_15530 [Pantoea wallisii]